MPKPKCKETSELGCGGRGLPCGRALSRNRALKEEDALDSFTGTRGKFCPWFLQLDPAAMLIVGSVVARVEIICQSIRKKKVNIVAETKAVDTVS